MRLVFMFMGPRLSKISYRMSECEKKLGYVCEEDESKREQQGAVTAAATAKEKKETLFSSIEEEIPPTCNGAAASCFGTVAGAAGGGSSSSSQYQSNSSLSSGSGEVTCVQLPWSKSTTDKSTKKRKQSKGSKSPSPFTATSANQAKLPTKRTKIWHSRFSSCSKKKELDLETHGKTVSSTCVCSTYRRSGSDADEQSRVQEAASTARRLATPFTSTGLGVFNPDDYPIEDEDEKMRRQRAKEMEEGVELSDQLRMLSCNGEGSYPQVHTQVDYIHCLVPDLKEITSCSFYWGKIDRYEAEKLLDAKPEGTFLLRDSAQEEYLFSVSFRRYGRSLHARIEQWGHSFSFDAHDPTVFSAPTVTGLIEHYKDPSCCMFFEPMLTTRLHRNFTFDLQHLARSVICNHVTYDAVNSLPLPKKLKTYCKEYHYKQRVRVRHIAE